MVKKAKKTAKRTQRKKGGVRRTCFVISALGRAGSLERHRANAVLKEIIQPALESPRTAYNATRIDRLGAGAEITEAIVDSLSKADLVVADLTGLNPNVMYELGIAHAWNVPLIVIIRAEELERLPFDLRHLRTVPYELTNKAKIRSAVVAIRKQLRSLMRGEQRHETFNKAVWQLGKRYAIDSVYDALLSAMSDMHQSLQDCRNELTHRDVWEDPYVVNDVGGVIRRTFRVFSDKLHVFRQILLGRICEASVDEEGVALIDECLKLSQGAIRLDVMLTDGRRTKKNVEPALHKLDTLMNKIRQLAMSVSAKRGAKSARTIW